MDVDGDRVEEAPATDLIGHGNSAVAQKAGELVDRYDLRPVSGSRRREPASFGREKIDRRDVALPEYLRDHGIFSEKRSFKDAVEAANTILNLGGWLYADGTRPIEAVLDAFSNTAFGRELLEGFPRKSAIRRWDSCRRQSFNDEILEYLRKYGEGRPLGWFVLTSPTRGPAQ